MAAGDDEVGVQVLGLELSRNPSGTVPQTCRQAPASFSCQLASRPLPASLSLAVLGSVAPCVLYP